MYKSKIMKQVECPICESQSHASKFLSSNFIKEELSNRFKDSTINNIVIPDYTLFKCQNCTFEFAYPFLNGTSSFYAWVTKQKSYYSEIRWEYTKVFELQKNQKGISKLLDVGCGDGNFLDFVKKKDTIDLEYYGLDTTQSSIEICINKGHKAYCMDIQQYKYKYPNEEFDIITCFHVLEHIANPKDFLSQLISLLKANGELFVATPYSPMSNELAWFDVLNNPPHHMGRWNIKSYMKLANELNLQMDYFMPDRQKFRRVVFQSFMLEIHKKRKFSSKKKGIIFSIIRKPMKFLKHLYLQFKREKINGRRVASVILVRFTK
jgi:2-polyprenyl-3-methyl-5-hydroxy-6-metoxy-1,4-benzoquinol methylase